MGQMECESVKQYHNTKVFSSKSIWAEMSQDKILQKHDHYPLVLVQPFDPQGPHRKAVDVWKSR